MKPAPNFVDLRGAGDPVEIARRYDEQGADEMTFLDITATSDERDLILKVIEDVAAQVFLCSVDRRREGCVKRKMFAVY